MSSSVMLITWASRGIGAATARLAARRGYSVVINYLSRRDAASALASEILSAGGSAHVVQADVGCEDDVLRMYDEIDRQVGALTALVNNTGVLEKQMRLDEMESRGGTGC